VPGFVNANGGRIYYFLGLIFALENNLNMWLKSRNAGSGLLMSKFLTFSS